VPIAGVFWWSLMAVTSSWVAHYLRIGQVGTCYNESCCLTGSQPAEALVVVFIVKMLSQKKKKDAISYYLGTQGD
jgi:hypothetical protein